MIKADIVMKVSDVSNVPRMKAVQAVDTIIDAMKEALCDGRRIELRGFGVFQVRALKQSVGHGLAQRLRSHLQIPIPRP